MPTSLRVHLLPSLVLSEDLRDRTVVVIDVLRATTTIIQAIAAGARQVIPCLEIDEVHAIAAKQSSAVLLGGERGGRKIPGFDLGNSPEEYSPAVVKDKTIVFTTTNGTKAMQRCRDARSVLIGAFVNFSALCERLSTIEQIDLICAGTDNQITREDVLLAGAVAEDMLEVHIGRVEMNDQALIALDAWRSAREDMRHASPLVDKLRGSRGGRNLLELGHERDIDLAADIDRFAIVPTLDLKDWVIVG